MEARLKVTAIALITSAFLTGCMSLSKLPANPPWNFRCKNLDCRQLRTELDLLEKQENEWVMAREPERLHLAHLEALTGRGDNFGLSELANARAEEEVVLHVMEAKGCR